VTGRRGHSVRLASINLNKRLGNLAAHAGLTAWLRNHRVDVLVAQEPWKPIDREPILLEGFQAIGGDGGLFAWIAEGWILSKADRLDTVVQRIELDWLVVFNVYLDASTRGNRAAQLVRLRQLVEAEDGRPVLLVGDFNLAPRPDDGRYDGVPSVFNTDVDRAPFVELLARTGLVDCTAGPAPTQYTFSRMLRGRLSEFRCDLALISDYLHPSLNVAYDHSVRVGGARFTDHSAVLIDLPVTRETTTRQERLFDLLEVRAAASMSSKRTDYHPHKTAMTRSHPSPFARLVADVLVPKMQIGSVLDHGCGLGADVHFYRDCGLEADGWDPHPAFGWQQEPHCLFDLVTNVFVLNVLPNPWERIKALKHAAQFVRPGGRLLVVTRSPRDVDHRAEAASWARHHDGYWSHEARGTFQRGVSVEEIAALARRAVLVLAPDQCLLSPVPAACQALFIKPA